MTIAEVAEEPRTPRKIGAMPLFPSAILGPSATSAIGSFYTIPRRRFIAWWVAGQNIGTANPVKLGA